MDRSIYRYILRNSLRGQLLVVALTLASLPFTYYVLEVPKQIINKGIGGENVPDQVFGIEVNQVQYLLALCLLFLGLVFINGGFKYVINVYKGVLGERLLRRLRYELFHRVLRFPLPQFKRLSQGEVIAITTAETEPLGAFIGDAIAEPALQGGVLLTYLLFIFNQDPFLGAAAVAIYPLQMWLVPRLQKRVNELGRQRVRTVRKMADRVGEGVSGITEIHVHGTARRELADIAARLGRVFDIRFEIYRRKYFIKFLNNFLASVTPFFFYSIGGYFVITGQLSMGALVAVLAAYKDLNPPWKALLKYYQTKEDMRVKYEQIVEQFSLPDLREPALIAPESAADVALDGPIAVSRLTYSEDGVLKTVDGVSFTIGAGESVAILGPGGSGKADLAQLLARLLRPTSGQIRFGDHDLAGIPDPVLGRHLGYVDQTPFIFSGSVAENLAYSLQQRPLDSPEADDPQRARHRREAILSGNTPDPIDAPWIDHALAGAADAAELRQRMLELLQAVGLWGDIYQLGLRGSIDPEQSPEVAERFVAARLRLRERLEERGIIDLVEPFDEHRYNDNATIAENLLFGTPLDARFQTERLPENPHLTAALHAVGIYMDLVDIGRRLAVTMVELFADLPPDHEFFEQFAFISAEDLPEYRALLGRVGDQAPAQILAADQRRLLALAFKLIPARHRLGLVDETLRTRILEARRQFASALPDSERPGIAFFESQRYNPAATLEDNILFGKLVHGAAHARERVGQLIAEVLDELDLRERVVDTGLDYHVGIAGGRLSATQRQKLAAARVLLKRPEVLILNEALAGLDPADAETVTDAVHRWIPRSRVIWVQGALRGDERVDRVIEMEGGQIASDRELAEQAAGAGADTALPAASQAE